MTQKITLAHGDGGKQSHALIQEVFVEPFESENEARFDAATVPWLGDKVIMSTDSFVVSPIFFKGGNIGKLAVCGTLNDIAVSGGIPKYLTCSFIIEEGFEITKLKTIVAAMKDEAKCHGVKIVAGDTKVVENGSMDGVFINTTGIGELIFEPPNPSMAEVTDAILVSGTVGDHGTSIMLAHEGLGISAEISSDCATLLPMTKHLLQELKSIRIMRDPTRGGLATSLVEIVEDFGWTIELEEEKIPIAAPVTGVCDILGFDPLYLANEGKLIIVVSNEEKERALEIMQSFAIGKQAAIIGEITAKTGGTLQLKTGLGGKRRLMRLADKMWPRIC